MSLARIFHYGSLSLEEKLARLHADKKHRVTTSGAWLNWWTWGDLHRDLANRKFSRWRSPAVENPGNVPDIASMLTDPVELSKVNHLYEIVR